MCYLLVFWKAYTVCTEDTCIYSIYFTEYLFSVLMLTILHFKFSSNLLINIFLNFKIKFNSTKNNSKPFNLLKLDSWFNFATLLNSHRLQFLTKPWLLSQYINQRVNKQGLHKFKSLDFGHSELLLIRFLDLSYLFITMLL